jgi:hypothetical protein
MLDYGAAARLEGGGDKKYFGLFLMGSFVIRQNYRNSHKLWLLCEFGGFHSNALRIPFVRHMKLRRWIVGREVWKESSSFEILESDFPVTPDHTRDKATLLC